MDVINKNISQEYLALKINYLRKQLKELPDAKLRIHMIRGIPSERIVVGNSRFNAESENGRKLIEAARQRDYCARQLEILEAVWHSRYKDEVFDHCLPHKVKRILYTGAAEPVVMDKAYFDSLRNDANTRDIKPEYYPYNGIYYRSAVERDIAIYYTDMGIEFKYEPEVYIKGLPRPIYTDFVIYIPELDCCKFHEHFGIRQSSTYLRVTGIKYNNYTNAGLIPEIDVLFTHDTEDMPFDIRAFASKLNTSIYLTAVSTMTPHRTDAWASGS